MTKQTGDTDLPLSLLRLVSQSLPVGAFAYSRGLEVAVRAGWVTDETSAQSWILGTLEHTTAMLDGPLFLRMMEALAADDGARFRDADDWLAAGRESEELRREDQRMCEALLMLLRELGIARPQAISADPRTFPGAFALAAAEAGVSAHAALMGLFWSQCDGQVAAAIRLGAIGQTAGQRILRAAQPVITCSATRAATLSDDDFGSVAFRQAMASAWHETLDGRLFRS